LAQSRCIDGERYKSSAEAAKSDKSKLSVDQALSAVGDALNCHNWVLLEPTKLELYNAGCGGLDEMKEWLLDDKVMFGILRFSFPRGYGAPPIVKYLFIHWIGPKVSAVRRGQWNSKLEDAVLKMRSACDFAFRKTAYVSADLELPNLIEELGRVTCITSSDTRQLSVDWYLEGLPAARPQPSIPGGLASTEPNSPLLRESAEHAVKIVRESGRQWKWVLLTVTEHRVPSSGGA